MASCRFCGTCSTGGRGVGVVSIGGLWLLLLLQSETNPRLGLKRQAAVAWPLALPTLQTLPWDTDSRSPGSSTGHRGVPS